MRVFLNLKPFFIYKKKERLFTFILATINRKCSIKTNTHIFYETDVQVFRKLFLFHDINQKGIVGDIFIR